MYNERKRDEVESGNRRYGQERGSESKRRRKEEKEEEGEEEEEEGEKRSKVEKVSRQ